jgi:hypothetical protein
MTVLEYVEEAELEDKKIIVDEAVELSALRD